jgi:biotin operon repressor
MAKKKQDQLRDFRADPYLRIHNFVIDRYLAKVGVYGLAVYAVLARYANNRTQQAFPAQQTVADLIGCSKTAVKEALRELRKQGLISVKQVGKPGKFRNIYTLLEPAVRRRQRNRDKIAENQGSAGAQYAPAGTPQAPAGSQYAPAGAPGASELYELDVDSVTQPKKETTQVTSATPAILPPSRAPLSLAVIPEKILKNLQSLLIEAGIDDPSDKRALGALRSAWAATECYEWTDTGQKLTPEEREGFVREAISNAAMQTADAAGIFTMALEALRAA